MKGQTALADCRATRGGRVEYEVTAPDGADEVPILMSRGIEMPGTYSQLLLHVVFSTKHRQRWITSDLAKDLYPFIGGIVRDEKGTLFDIGGIEDHVHLYLRWRTDGAISELMRNVKARSSAWIH